MIKDYLGNEIAIGDTVAFGYRDGNSGAITVKEIKAFDDKGFVQFTTGGWTSPTKCIVLGL